MKELRDSALSRSALRPVTLEMEHGRELPGALTGQQHVRHTLQKEKASLLSTHRNAFLGSFFPIMPPAGQSESWLLAEHASDDGPCL